MAPPHAISPTTNTSEQAAAPKPPSVTPSGQKLNAKGMTAWPSLPQFENPLDERTYLKERLALAFRIFAKLGFEEGVAGHITVRDPVDRDTFWLNPFGVPFALISASNLIRVNGAGHIIDGGEVRLLNDAAFAIHHAVHAARDDVVCAAHSHSIYGRAFSTLGKTIDIITQDSCAFYNDVALYNQFGGIVWESLEGQNIAAALGNKKAAILQNHGLLTVGGTIEATLFWFVSLDRCCQVQLLADAAAAGRGGETTKVNAEEAAYTYKAVGSPAAGYFSALPMFEMMARECNNEHKL